MLFISFEFVTTKMLLEMMCLLVFSKSSISVWMQRNPLSSWHMTFWERAICLCVPLPFCRKDTGRKWPLLTRHPLWKKFWVGFCPLQNIQEASTCKRKINCIKNFTWTSTQQNCIKAVYTYHNVHLVIALFKTTVQEASAIKLTHLTIHQQCLKNVTNVYPASTHLSWTS